MQRHTLALFFIVSFLWCPCNTYNILAFLPLPLVSHHNVFLPLLNELSRLGHNVTYYTSVRPRVVDRNLKVRLIPTFKNQFAAKMDLVNLGLISIPSISHKMSTTAEAFSEVIYGNPVAQDIIHSSDSYDAVIMESYFMQEPVSALIHKFGCVGIEVSSLGDSAWLNEWSGLPSNPAYQLDFKSRMSDEMTTMERLYNSYVIGATLAVSYYHLYKMQAVMDRYFNYSGWESRPSLHTLMGNRGMILVNTDPTLSYPYPTAPHVKNIAGINLQPNEPLPQDIQKFMDEAKSGVIYFSLGSNLNTSAIMSSKMGKSFMNIFKKLPQRVLMKWEENMEDIGDSLPNVRTSNWFPQKDILAHKNCVLFVTHGGFLSITEAVYYGVPIVGLPFFADQPKNMIQAQKSGYGLMISNDNITEQSLTWALREVINNPKYKEEAEKRSEMFRLRRFSPMEEAVRWVEHAMKFPSALAPRAAQMSFWEKRMYDMQTFYFLAIACAYVGVTLLTNFVKRMKKAVTDRFKVKLS